jgi:photosystem II stability/assembly factor-like uncharacterized protein
MKSSGRKKRIFMKGITLTLIIAFNFQPFTFNCLAQWYQQNSGTTAWLNGIYFVNANTGTAVGDSGIVLRTTNGGLNWFRQNSGLSEDAILQKVCFVNANFGTIVGSRNQGGLILHTSNGGETWIKQESPNPYWQFVNLKFIDESTGYAVGRAPGVIIKTTNSGRTWSEVPQSQNPYAHWSGIDFVNANTGWVAGSDVISGGVILKTTNGGANWERQDYFAPFGSQFYSISFIDALTGVVAGDYIFLTTNGGINWIRADSNRALNSVKMINSNIGTAVGYNWEILRSTNGGHTWDLQPPPVTAGFLDVSFADPNIGWIAGTDGTILHTTNGGVIGIQPIRNKVPEKFQLYQNYPNPFNPRTKIKFDIPVETGLRPVSTRLVVYDVLGKEISILVNQQLHPGTYEVDFDGANYPSGVYFYRLETGNYIETRKMIIER